jgi:hypothetical protein
MPIYTFRDTETGEEGDLNMTIAEMEQFIKDNPHFERVYTSVNIGDPVSLGILRPPTDFQKYVLGKVKAKNPLGSVENRWTIKKEV